MTTLLSSLITLYYSPFYSDVYLVENISFRLSSQQVYSAGDRFFCNTPLIFCICVHCFIRVWFLTCWRAPYKCYVGSLVGYYKCFVLVRIIFIRVWFVTGWPLSRYVSHTSIRCIFHSVRNGSFLIPFVPSSQFSINFCLYTICLQRMCASEGLTSWIVLEYHSYVNLEVFVYYW